MKVQVAAVKGANEMFGVKIDLIFYWYHFNVKVTCLVTLT